MTKMKRLESMTGPISLAEISCGSLKKGGRMASLMRREISE